MSESKQQLMAHILPLSKSTHWEEAVKEWSLVGVYEGLKQCPCGQYPIIEICMIANGVTGNATEVGNVCVKNFMGLPSDHLFQALRRIRKDPSRPLSARAADHFFNRGVFNDWEHGFLIDTARKRRMSLKQIEIRRKLNMKVIQAIKNLACRLVRPQPRHRLFQQPLQPPQNIVEEN
jgi:hypothetical protein